MMAAVAQRDIPWPFAELLHRQTEGNPLFVQEMLRYLVEEGLVSEQDGALRRVGDDPLAGRIPEGLRDVIGRRLSRLSAECNRLLAIASVIGRDFRLDTLQAVANVEAEALEGALEEATKVGVLEEQARGGVVAYRFTHAFFRQTLYEELSAPRRIRMHQQVARALEVGYGRRLEEHASELAEHYSNSSDHSDLAKAVEYGELAAKRAMSVFDYGEAVRLLDKTIDVQEVLDPDDKAKRCQLLLLLAEALLPAGQLVRAAEDICEAAFELGEALQDSESIERAIRFAHESMSRSGGPAAYGTAAASRWAQRASRYARPGSAAGVDADSIAALVAFANRDFSEGQRLMRSAYEGARRVSDADPSRRVTVRGLAVFRTVAGYVDSLLSSEEMFRVLPSGQPGGFSLSLSALGASNTFFMHGQRQHAMEARQLVDVSAEHTGDSRVRLISKFIDGHVALWDGQLEEAVEVGRALHAIGQEQGWSIAFGYSEQVSGPALVLLGRARDALAGLDTEPGIISVPEALTTAAVRPVRLAQAGFLSEASSLLRRLLIDWQFADQSQDMPATTLHCLLEAAVLVGDKESSAVIVGALSPLPPLAYFPTLGSCPTRAIGEAWVLLDQPERARSSYDAAIDICQKAGFRPEIALTRLELAELLLEHYPDEHESAIEHLDFAIREFQEMKMQPSLERALRHRGLLKA
jgi:tetratricopeptide (TPR) repeat protein